MLFRSHNHLPLPIEVKSGRRGSMRSLHLLMEEKKLPLAVRISEENFGELEDGRIRIIPLYFAGEFSRFLRG